MKGLILCAGRGTRLHPFSYTQPKTLLPVANQPVLHYGIGKLVELGVTEIAIVIHPAQTQIRHFIGDGKRYPAAISFIEQVQPLGIAHAVSLAQSFIQGEPFLLLLGDNLLLDSLQPLWEAFSTSGADCAVMLSEVDRPQDYGIAVVQEGRIISIEEKPKQPKSNLAVIGVYAFRSNIFDHIRTLSPSARGEYEITDAIQSLIRRGGIVAHTRTAGKYFDVGTIDRWLSANRTVLDQILGERVSVGARTVMENCELTGPIVIGDGCKLVNCKLGPNVSIQDGAELTNCRHIQDSILLENTTLTDIDWMISNSIFGRSSHLVGKSPSHAGVFIVSDKSYILLPLGERRNES